MLNPSRVPETSQRSGCFGKEEQPPARRRFSNDLCSKTSNKGELGRNFRKEEVVKTQKMAILYERLSKEDERENESVSIENQKSFLEDYATKNGYANFVHLTDDGWSGTRWDRPGYLKMIDEVERGVVDAVIVKDMSRIGRDHLRVGLLLEKFRECGVRFIAVNDSVDTDKGMDDFTPFRNIINEWVARDTSRKIRAINDARTKAGKHVTGAIPYGYLHNPSDRQQWILDEEAATNVARIFQSVIDGKNLNQIANELASAGILTPSAHWRKLGIKTPGAAGNADPTKWMASTIIAILQKEEYMGWKVLNKTHKETYKSKRCPSPENRLIFKDSHPAIVSEEMWNLVQRLRETRRRPERINDETNPLTGILFCADCGHKMYFKQRSAKELNQFYQEYVCSSYRNYSRNCTCHYIRVSVVEDLILDTIRRVSKYVRQNEQKFIERVRAELEVQQGFILKENRKKLSKHKHRREEINVLIKKLYETFALKQIPEKHFSELLAGYDDEQTKIDCEIAELETAVERYNTNSIQADKFIELVKKHMEFPKLTPTLLNEFIEKVEIHEAVRVPATSQQSGRCGKEEQPLARQSFSDDSCPQTSNEGGLRRGRRTMQVDIHLNFIGKIDLSDWEENQPSTGIYETAKRKRLRKDMTEEEIECERERDRKRYAKKKAAKIAAEEAERTALLKETKFANVG